MAGLPSYKMVDTCAAEFPANTPYFYSTYEPICEIVPTDTKKVLILGSGRSGSARVLNSITAPSMQCRHCGKKGLRCTSSTTTRRPFPRTSTPPTASSLSPCSLRML